MDNLDTLATMCFKKRVVCNKFNVYVFIANVVVEAEGQTNVPLDTHISFIYLLKHPPKEAGDIIIGLIFCLRMIQHLLRKGSSLVVRNEFKCITLKLQTQHKSMPCSMYEK